MISDSMACDERTDRAGTLQERTAKATDHFVNNQLGLDMYSSLEPVPRPNREYVVDAFHFRAALSVTFLPNNSDE